MQRIPWEQVLGAIKLRDAAKLRLLAQQARCEQRRALLLVFADIVDNGTPIVEAGTAVRHRIAAPRIRPDLQPTLSARVMVRTATRK